MAKKGDLTRDQVVHIKLCMLKGWSNVDLARLYKKSAETMSRIRTGVSHAGVKVVGEEALWPAAQGGEEAVRVGEPEMPGASAREVEASLALLLKKLGGVGAAPAAGPETEAEIDFEAREREWEEADRKRRGLGGEGED